MIILKPIIVLFLLIIVFGTNKIALFTVSPLTESQIQCPNSTECIPLSKCEPLLHLLESSDKSHPVIQLLRVRLCGFHKEEPKFCCSHLKIGQNLSNQNKSCNFPFKCVDLSDCPPLAYLLTLDNSKISESVIKIVRSQQCDSESEFPKVCCRDPSHELVPKIHAGDSLDLSEKSEAINKAFEDIEGESFFFVRRKRYNRGDSGDELDVEIR